MTTTNTDDAVLAALHVLQHQTPDARLSPCFIGPTGSGKTARAAEVARALGLRLVVLLPGTALPEDILGLPRVIRGRTVWSTPDWASIACNEPTLVLIDELDKARVETRAALLTLLTSHEVRGAALHPRSRVLAAMQPIDRAEWLGDETGRALSARLVFLPVAYSRGRLAQKLGLDAAALEAAAGAEQAPIPPVLPVLSDRQIEAAHRFWSAARGDDALRVRVLAGIAGERADALATAFSVRAAIAPRDVVRAAVTDLDLLGTLSVPELVALAGPAQVHGTPAVMLRVLRELANRGTADDWASAIRGIRPYVEGCLDAEGRGRLFEASSADAETDIAAMIDGIAELIREQNARKGKPS